MNAVAAQPRLIVIGYRRSALRALHELGVPYCLVVNRRPMSRKLSGPVVETLFDAPDAISRITAMVPDASAVVALVESAVVLCGALREHYGLARPHAEDARACADKVLMKRRLRAAGLPCTDWIADTESPDRNELIARLGLPLVVKLRCGSGGRNVRWSRSAESVPAALADGWMAERVIEGVEMSVESIVRDGQVAFVNLTEYFEPRWANVVPAALPRATEEHIRLLNQQAVTALGVERGITHMEVFLTADGPVIGELAARPPGGWIMELLHLAWGFDAWQDWLRVELGENVIFPASATRCAGMRIFHPGPGTVTSVSGLEELRTLPGFAGLHSNALQPGRSLESRVGSGQQAGHVLFASPDRAVVIAGLLQAALVKIDITPA